MTTLSATNSISRRTAIAGGMVYGLACLNSRRMLAAAMLPIASGDENRSDAELYAFSGPDSSTTVIAVTFREVCSEASVPYELRIHAGSRDWVFETTRARPQNFPVFMGKVVNKVRSGKNTPHACDALVLEVPNSRLAGVERSGIWAERFSRYGERHRIGSPFLAAVMMNSDRLARDYHAIGPSQDREVLFEGVVDAVAAEAQNTPQIGDPRAYGRRLASRLLPDFLHYNPELPRGFSFAARNGRHPGEDAAAVVGTTLNGSPLSAATTGSWRLGNVFPYFSRPAAAA